MNILIPDKWLRNFVLTKATASEIAKYVSLCGPSVEKVLKTDYGPVYSVEITGNRVDVASIYGFAREVAAILPQFGIKAKLKDIVPMKAKFAHEVTYLKANVDTQLCPHFTTALIKNVVQEESPDWLKDKLCAAGSRPINNIVDISNYVMYETGQPIHTFDYDKISNHLMILRESKKGETVVTLDGIKRSLQGGDIVIEDGSGKLIDLCGIMGGKVSAVDANTKNVLLFVQTYNPQKIRRTSMLLSHRTNAAVLLEKDLDPEAVYYGLSRSLELFGKLTGGIPEKEILDIYPKGHLNRKINLDNRLIEKKLGVAISRKQIKRHLNALGFKVVGSAANMFSVTVPSYRAKDILIPEDLIEEIARIHGYQNLPSKLMDGRIPDEPRNGLFTFESNLKKILKGYGGNEVYTLSLVGKTDAAEDALKLINPLGNDSVYLRTSLLPSLKRAIAENKTEKEPFWLFEIANIYLPKKGNLPEEKEILGAIFKNTSYRNAKGILEALLQELHLNFDFEQEDAKDFIPSKRLVVKASGIKLGVFGELVDGEYYFELAVQLLFQKAVPTGEYHAVPKFPAQIEDLTFNLPQKTKIGGVITTIKTVDRQIEGVALKDIYKEAYTFRVRYLNPAKTLTNTEVKLLRDKIIVKIKNKFGGNLK
jgi:phenylalanyl-tRNA synthetase beta chain